MSLSVKSSGLFANLEIRSEKIREVHIEAEKQRIKREQEERERRNFEERKKADWLDQYISKKDQFLDNKDIDALIQPECPKTNSLGYPYYTQSVGNSFWSSPFSKWS